MAGEKRPGGEIQDAAGKKQKSDNQQFSPIVPNVQLNSLHVSQIDKYITKPSLDSGIGTVEELKILEARFTSPLTAPFVDAQLRLLAAQQQYHKSLGQYASANQNAFSKKMNADQAVQQSTRLIALAKSSECRPDIHDAILYRATFMAFYGAFACNGGANSHGASKKFEEIIKKADLDVNVPGLIELLTAASERHLSKKTDRSIIWGECTTRDEENISASPTMPTTSTPFTNTSDLTTDKWVAIKAQDFITSFDQLKFDSSLTSWDAVDNVSAEDKSILRSMRGEWRIASDGEQDTPDGVLLYGPQGSGKTTFVRNWCRFVKGTLIEFNATAKGHLEGMTEQLLTSLINKAIEIGRKSPVVLFLDEADQLLAGGTDERACRIQSTIKALFAILEQSKSEVYFFATTNTPGSVKWNEGWNRRLQLKFYVRLPGVQGRTAIMMPRLASIVPGITKEQVSGFAERLEGYSASDLARMIGGFRRTRGNDGLFTTEFWLNIDHDGSQILVPAKKDDIGVMACHFDDLPKEDAIRVRRKPATVEDLAKHIETCLRDPRSKSVTAEEIKQHEDWTSKFYSL